MMFPSSLIMVYMAPCFKELVPLLMTIPYLYEFGNSGGIRVPWTHFYFCYTLLCVHFSFAITLKRKRKLVALLLLSYRCIVMDVVWLFLTVPWVGLQCVAVVFPDHTHLLFDISCYDSCELYTITRLVFLTI